MKRFYHYINFSVKYRRPWLLYSLMVKPRYQDRLSRFIDRKLSAISFRSAKRAICQGDKIKSTVCTPLHAVLVTSMK